MKPTRKLKELWNWLPVFRAVAETEHLPTAAKALLVSSASLSRTIGLLEENLGHPLFDRVGRNLRLNSAGKSLLQAVRNGMRVIEEGVSVVNGELWTGQLGLWAQRPYSDLFLVPLMQELQSKHPGIELSLQSSAPNTVAQRILQGEIDLAIIEVPPRNEALQIDALRKIQYAYYCAKDHPLVSRKSLTILQACQLHSFAVIDNEKNPVLPSHWPPDVQRKPVILVEDHGMAIQACLHMKAIAYLPTILAKPRKLHRLPLTGEFPNTTLHVIYRKKIGRHPRTEAMLEILTKNTHRIHD